MAGSLDPEGGNSSRYAEFNVHVDPKAARKVLDCGRPMFWAPLEVARQASVDRMWIDLLRATDRPCCNAGADMLEFYLKSFEKPAAALYDPLAVMWLIAPNLFEVERDRARDRDRRRRARRPDPLQARRGRRQYPGRRLLRRRPRPHPAAGADGAAIAPSPVITGRHEVSRPGDPSLPSAV